MTKEEARKRADAAVGRMSAAEKEWASDAITDALVSLEVFRKAKRPFVYLATPREPDTEAIVGLFLAMERTVAVPRVRGREMDAVVITPYTDFKKNKWGISEPVKGHIAEKCDLAVVPLAAFDGLKRVGRGGGYYDRFLARMKNCVKVGIAFSCRRAEGVEFEPHDIDMDIVITEKEIIPARGVSVANEFEGADGGE